MTSKNVPHADKALLEAQAQAGAAGVAAYEAAKAQFEQSSQQTLAAAAEASRARGGPAGAMQHAMSTAEDLVNRRMQSMEQAQASQARQYESRQNRMEDYTGAVQGARSLIADQAAAAAQPTRLRSELEIQQMRQRAQGNVEGINAQMQADEARFNAELRAAEQAAAAEQARWEREMEQRERLAALSRAASARKSGGAKPPTLTATEMQEMLKAGGIERLNQVVGALQDEVIPYYENRGDLRPATEAVERGRMALDAAGGVMFGRFVKPPNMGDYPNRAAFDAAVQDWADLRDQFTAEGPTDELRREAAKMAAERQWLEQRGRAQDFPGGPQSIGASPSADAVAARLAEFNDLIARDLPGWEARAAIDLEQGIRGLRDFGFGTEEQIRSDPLSVARAASGYMPATPTGDERLIEGGGPNQFRTDPYQFMAADLLATQPELAPYLQDAYASGTNPGMPDFLSLGLGMQEPGAYQWDDRLSESENMRLAQQYMSRMPTDDDAALAAFERAQAEGVGLVGLDQYSINPAELRTGFMQNKGTSYLNAMTGDERSYQEIIDAVPEQFQSELEDRFNAIQAREDQAWEDYTRSRTMSDDAQSDRSAEDDFRQKQAEFESERAEAARQGEFAAIFQTTDLPDQFVNWEQAMNAATSPVIGIADENLDGKPLKDVYATLLTSPTYQDMWLDENTLKETLARMGISPTNPETKFLYDQLMTRTPSYLQGNSMLAPDPLPKPGG